MGVDLYMKWDGQTEEDKKAQHAAWYRNVGKYGYLRGAYFGGLSDVLRYLFDWMDWDEEAAFDPVEFKTRLIYLESTDGSRPGKGRWDYTQGTNMDFSWRQNARVDKETLQQYWDFLALGTQLKADGKNPRIRISY